MWLRKSLSVWQEEKHLWVTQTAARSEFIFGSWIAKILLQSVRRKNNWNGWLAWENMTLLGTKDFIHSLKVKADVGTKAEFFKKSSFWPWNAKRSSASREEEKRHAPIAAAEVIERLHEVAQTHTHTHNVVMRMHSCAYLRFENSPTRRSDWRRWHWMQFVCYGRYLVCVPKTSPIDKLS